MTDSFHSFHRFNRPRVPRVLVRDTRRPTLLAEDAARCLSTSRRRLALLALTPMLRPDLVSFYSHLLDLMLIASSTTD